MGKKSIFSMKGKKRAIAAIFGCIIAWAQARAYIDPETSVMLASILTVITGVGIADAVRKR